MKYPSLLFLGVLTLCGCLSTRTLVRYEPKTYTPAVLDSRERVATLANKRYDQDTVGQSGFNLRSVDGVSVMTMVARDQLIYLNPGEKLHLRHRLEGNTKLTGRSAPTESKCGFSWSTQAKLFRA